MYIILPATIIYTQEQIQCPVHINVEAGPNGAVGYLILYYLKHYAWGCLLAHISIYTCLCITMNVYIRLSFHVDGKQGWKTPVRVLKTL